ncbi:transglutaminase-like cysteine peptidase [Stakelama sp. CBK3Z-3]|uniref:Transglutaminase-like cysteine peptidase n=1 Tax=Stakelama flava TaxID=2860338 RepID=A0ABS6XI63_9SPHN|nr:transglutaminase-like cysteine peptidase [Stakelama flava]MBW4329909.1 transglutaminase-like cysteine peptidase [Stakelama flava]
MMRAFYLAAVTIAGMLLYISPALATSQNSLTIPEVAVSEPPTGYSQMCTDRMLLCMAEGIVALHNGAWDSDSLMHTLRDVNRSVNRNMRWRADRTENWTGAEIAKGASGDCEDFAITKRLQLLGAGFPAERLSYAVAYVPRTGLHTVLIANVDGVDLVLDNRTPWIERWSDTHYVWLLKQSVAYPNTWYTTYPDSPPGKAVALAA